jgi:hypothetical protein
MITSRAVASSTNMMTHPERKSRNRVPVYVIIKKKKAVEHSEQERKDYTNKKKKKKRCTT